MAFAVAGSSEKIFVDCRIWWLSVQRKLHCRDGELYEFTGRCFLPLGVALKRKVRASGGCLGTERR